MNIYLFKIYQFFKFKKIGFPESPNDIVKLLMESQYWSRKKMEIYQLKKLNKLLSIANSSSDFYKNIYNNKDLLLLDLDQFKSKIPLIKKNEVVDNFEMLKTKNFSNRNRHATSGSTGEPLVIYISGESEAYREACRMRFRNWWGIKENDKSVYIARKDLNRKETLFFMLKEHLRKRFDIDIFDLNDKTILKYYKEIEKFKPTYIRGYKSGILELAQLMETYKLSFRNFKLKVAIVTSEVLYEDEREFIEKILKCKVANEYGAVEAGLYAYECQDGSMHINEEAVYMYTNNKNDAIVTELDNDCIPLINYKNDDKISISEDYCSCGRTSRIIKVVNGRISGDLIRPDGSKVNQFIIPIILRKCYSKTFNKKIRKYKVIQKGKTFIIKIVPMENYNKECEDYIKERMYEEVGEDIDIRFELVDKIERNKSGKYSIFEREY